MIHNTYVQTNPEYIGLFLNIKLGPQIILDDICTLLSNKP